MKYIVLFFALLFIAGCDHNREINQKISSQNGEHQKVNYSEKELTYFLDSIGKLDPNQWTKRLTFTVDSTLRSPVKLDKTLNQADFQKLKNAVKAGKIDLDVAKSMFPKLLLANNLSDSILDNKVPVGFYSFDKNEKDWNEFAISIGDPNGISWSNDIYFFKANKVIAKHKINHQYGLNLNHFTNGNNQTIIYYSVNYQGGTGIWWNQYNFYCYDSDKILPILTEIDNLNLQFPWSIRAYLIESTIIKSNPLTLKFVFYNEFKDTLGNQFNFLNDSTEVSYSFDKQKKMYEPIFKDQKLSKLKLLTYFHADNELLFVNVNYHLFKKHLYSKDTIKRQIIFNYLNELKNQHEMQ